MQLGLLAPHIPVNPVHEYLLLKPQLAGGRLPVLPVRTYVLAHHGTGPVPGLAHDREFRGAVAICFGGEPRPQRMGPIAGKLASAQAGPAESPFDDPPDRMSSETTADR